MQLINMTGICREKKDASEIGSRKNWEEKDQRRRRFNQHHYCQPTI